ncbi:ABC transporter permease subunit [uncultured Serinicoccus sp.]|uniref:ABC transporter permease subunit n=1 Tax=uncultured Serinicoccus sp. TaxID=735514 RepID=UPI002633DDDF|nr:ABC transporter permease subunit [uncultured Serinicoccus sp.]
MSETRSSEVDAALHNLEPTGERLEFSSRTPLWVQVVKWGLILLTLAVLGWMAQQVIEAGYWLMVSLIGFIALCVIAVYATKRAIPAKYLFPGVLLMLLLQIWPLIYTVQISFTNFGDGHISSKEEAVASIVSNSVREVEGSSRYALNIAVPEGTDVATGDLAYLLTDAEGAYYVGTIDGLEELPADGVEAGPTGRIISAPGWTTLTPQEVNDRSDDLADFGVPVFDDAGEQTAGIRQVGLSEAFIGTPTRVYDEEADTITDTVTGTVYVAEDANFVPENGEGAALPQGWREFVGFENYTNAFTNATLREGLTKVFVWNVFFAAFTVVATFLLGMAIALLMNDERLKGKGVYRSILILPYALPIYVTALVWASMFNQDFGLINNLFGLDINWLGSAWWARVAVLITNLWLGFPYWFIVCTGALQAIPSDVKEAAAIDGAGAFATVRRVIMPLLLVAVGPLMIASFAFNFNNFGLIWLLTEGGPFVGGQSSIGSTDLLITLAYRLALGGAAPNFGFASAISVIIFFMVAVISYFGFTRTAALEDVN